LIAVSSMWTNFPLIFLLHLTERWRAASLSFVWCSVLPNASHPSHCSIFLARCVFFNTTNENIRTSFYLAMWMILYIDARSSRLKLLEYAFRYVYLSYML
jgi:hypothetical protein